MSVEGNALLTVRAKTDIIYLMLLRAGGFGAAFMQWQQGKQCGRGGMADTLVLGANASACGFKSHRPHQVKVMYEDLNSCMTFLFSCVIVL